MISQMIYEAVNFILVLTDEETAVQRETCRQEKENMI
jgi:hypothetical protein